MNDEISGINAPQLLRSAAALIQDEHDVPEMTAYTMLVQSAVDSGTSVREAAARILMGPAEAT